MGRDKALLPWDGRPLIEFVVEKLRGVGLRVRICGARPDLASLAEVAPDNFAGAGPLAGIEAALAVSDSELNLLVAVDLPGLPPGFLRWMAERAETSHAVATIPRHGDRVHPLCAVYSRRLLRGLQEALTAGRNKVLDGIGEAAAGLGESIDAFDVEPVAASGPKEWPVRPMLAEWFRNVNTPGDYEALRATRVG